MSDSILDRFSFLTRPWRVAEVSDSAGFSGARLWRIESAAGTYCLRRWPTEHPSRDRLLWTHGVLQRVRDAGVSVVAAPLADDAGTTIIELGGARWELAPWMPGTADYHSAPSLAKLTAALQCLAHFHHAANDRQAPIMAAPPGIVARRHQLNQLLTGGATEIQSAIRPGDWPKFAELSAQWLALFPRGATVVWHDLDRASHWQVPVQPCIRDVWHDHLLFTGERLTGLIDFGAMREDHVACDLARLLGSLVGDDVAGWSRGLAAYEQLRPLTSVELELVAIYDRSSILLSGANWLRWVYLERRHFSARRRVEERLSQIILRQRSLDISASSIR